jgi:hypothetical protein
MLMLILFALTSGCATFVAPTYSPDYSALDSLKRQKISKIAIEPVEPKGQTEKVNKITLRGATLASPSGTFAQYLEDAIKSDLIDANLLDPNSFFRLFVFLLNNNIDVAGFSTGYGTIEANFKINRNGTVVFDKRIAAKTEFESSFAGAVAIPKGQNEYPNLVRILLKKLYTDKDFINVLQN